MKTKKVRIISRVGDPQRGVIIQPGTVTDLPEVWADRYVSRGAAEFVESEPEKPAAKPKKGK